MTLHLSRFLFKRNRMSTQRHQSSQQPLPPVSRAHQEGLRALITSMHATGQDVALLTQLAESLPRLRAGLSAADRQRIEELDANDTVMAHALSATQEAIAALDTLIGDPAEPLSCSVLVDASTLRRIAAAAQLLAEAANDLALHTGSRAGLLE
jgi:hypothetical protein